MKPTTRIAVLLTVMVAAATAALLPRLLVSPSLPKIDRALAVCDRIEAEIRERSHVEAKLIFINRTSEIQELRRLVNARRASPDPFANLPSCACSVPVVTVVCWKGKHKIGQFALTADGGIHVPNLQGEVFSLNSNLAHLHICKAAGIDCWWH